MNHYTSYRDAKRAGLILVGEWGGSPTDGVVGFFCTAEDRPAVQAAYYSLPEDPSFPCPGLFDGILEAGGIVVPDTTPDTAREMMR